MRNRGVGVLIAFCLFVLSASSLMAQGTAGRIEGTVADQSGGAMAGATVTITDVARNTSRTLKTDESGAYNAPNLLPSTYMVRGEANGFKAVERPNILLEIGGDVRVDLALQPGEVTQTVTVTETVPLVQTTNGELGGTLQSQAIAELPLNGRNFENLLQLRPGVFIYPGGTSSSQSTNGLRAKDNIYMVDGIAAFDPWTGQSIMNAVMNAGDAGTILSVDSIDEFKTTENPAAEYGWKPGSVVNVGIKSGTNTIHGTAFAYGRDTALDARNYYDAPPAPKAPVSLEQFGATIGGPIKKDKLFYFANFEQQQYEIGNPAQRTFPETIAGGGTTNSLIDACIAAAKGTTVATQLTPLSAQLAGLSYNKATLGTANPTGNCTPVAAQLTNGGQFQFMGLFPVNNTNSTLVYTATPNNNKIQGGLGKIDYHLNDHNSFQGMYFFSQGDNIATTAAAPDIATQWLTVNHGRSETASGSWTWTPNSTWVNEARFGYAHYYQSYLSNDSNLNPASYPFLGNTYELPTGVTNPLYFGFPQITINSLGSPNGIGQQWPKIVGPDGVLTLIDHISVLRGKHAFKFGVEYEQLKNTEDVTASAKGPVTFTNYVNFFSGTISTASLLTGNPIRHLSDNGYAAFIQDDWRIKPRLTLNLGLRYDVVTVVKDSNNLLGNFDPNRGLQQVGIGLGVPYDGDHNNFAPRLGFAWDIFGDGKTVVRGSGTVVYETQMDFDAFNGVGNAAGLRAIPTGLPLYNNGSTTPLPLTGTIDLSLNSYTQAAVNPISSAWRAFNPALPVSAQPNALLYANANAGACGDNFTNPGLTRAPTPCSIVAVAPHFRTPYVTSWSLGIQRSITSVVSLDLEYVGNHATKLLGQYDANQPQLVNGFSPGWGNPAVVGTPANICANGGACTPNANAEQAARPFTAPCTNAALFGPSALNGHPITTGGPFNPGNTCLSYLSSINVLVSGYDSNYNALQAVLTSRNYHGLTFNAAYTWSHSLGDASDQGTPSDFPLPINSYGDQRQQIYGTTNFDVRNRVTLSGTYNIPGRPGFGQLLQGWTLNGIALLQGGSPWSMAATKTSEDFSGTGENTVTGSQGEHWDFYGDPSAFTPVHGFTATQGIPFFSGTAPSPACIAADNAAFSGDQLKLAMASLKNLGCYALGNAVLAPPPYGSYGTPGRGFWRDEPFRNLDMSVGKSFKFTERFSAQFRAEVFNVLNHPLFSNPNGLKGHPQAQVGIDPGASSFGYAGATADVASGNPQLGSGGSRSIQLGLKLLW